MRVIPVLALLVLLAGCQFGPDASPLITAARTGDSRAITALVRAGADPNRRSGVNDWTPLQHAVHKRQPGSVEALVNSGAKIDARGGAGETALMMAAGYGYTEIVELLLDRGANPYLTARGGVNALALAVTGVSDMDEFTLARCQLDTVQALLRGAPGLKVEVTSTSGRAMVFAKLEGCSLMAGYKNRRGAEGL